MGFPSILDHNDKQILTPHPQHLFIAQHNLPLGKNAAGIKRPPAQHYLQFQQRTPIWVRATRYATNALRARDFAHTHVRFDAGYPWTRAANDAQARCLLDAHTPLAAQATHDPPVYAHTLYNLARYPDTAFAFATMRDLYFFLLHAKRRLVYLYVRNVEVVNCTEGKWVFQALQLLGTCASLERLTLWCCPRCREIRCPPNVWRALRRFRAPSALKHAVVREGAERLRVVERPDRLKYFCAACKLRGATEENQLGEPVSKR